jgi:hypothetical protein
MRVFEMKYRILKPKGMRTALTVVLGFLVVASAAIAQTAPFEVRRAGVAATVRPSAPAEVVTTSPYDDASGTLSDGALYFYVISDALAQGVSLSVHKNPATDSVRLGFNDGDPLSAPLDPDNSPVTAAPASIPADGASVVTITVIPRDAWGVPLGTGLSVVVDESALWPGTLLGPVVDRGDGSYVFQVISSDPGQATASVTVEGLDLTDEPTLDFLALFDTEFQVNVSSPGKQERPVVGQSAAGGLVVIWQGEDGDDKGIFGRIFAPDGSSVGGEFEVNTTVVGKQERPAVSVAADGSFVVVWESDDSDGDGVFGQRFAADGTPLGGEFQVNTTETGNQDRPRLAVGSDGGFAVVWEAEDANKSGVFAQVYGSAGQPVGGEILVNETESGDQKDPDLSVASDGTFVVVWRGEDASGEGVWGRRFDAGGTALAGEFLAHDDEAGKQDKPVIAMSGSGEFVVVWQLTSGPQKDVFARRFDSGGNPQGLEFQVNTSEVDNQDQAHAAMADDGGFVVAWKSKVGGQQIFARRYEAGGVPVGGEFQISEPTSVKPDKPRVGYARDKSSFVVVWQAEDADNKGVFARWIPVN